MVQKSKMTDRKIKNIILNHLMINGNKKTCETTLLKSLKNIQKDCNKPHKTIIKIAIINSTSAFRLIQLKQKKRKIKKKKNSKEIPIFISNNNERIIWALKFIVQNIKKNTTIKLHSKLTREIISNSQNKGNSLQIKTDLHKQTITKKRMFLYFRW